MNDSKNRFWVALAAAAVLIFGGVFAGCGADSGNDDNGDGASSSGADMNTSSSGDGGGDGTMASSGTSSGGSGSCAGTPVLPGDCDGDGILDTVEAMTGTDLNDPDGDKDGICDGSNTVEGVCIGGEDLNNNGQVDPGEFDPRTDDTDMNGVPDNLEPQFLVCRDEYFSAIEAKDATAASTVLALPDSFTLTAHAASSAVAFSDATAKIYGYVVTESTTDSIGVAHLSNMADIGVTNKRTNDIATRFTSWLEVANGRPDADNALRSKGSFGYGAGTPNDPVASKDPAVLRDEVISAISGADVSTGENGVACAKIVNYHVSELRTSSSGDVLISVGVLACEEDIDVDVQNFFDDVLTTTIYAPIQDGVVYLPKDPKCDVLEADSQGGVVDFLWVIDNSGSMSDEQENVANTTQQFLERLQTSNTDWRIAVTTTDAYCLDDDSAVFDSCRQRLNEDMLREPCTGLRGPGFLSEGQANVEANFQSYVTENSTCGNGTFNPPDSADNGKNVCGFGLESGLKSAQTVIQRLNDTERADGCPTGPDYELRSGADVVVIFVTDEEDQELKNASSVILPADDPTRAAKTDQFITTFRDLFDVRVYSISGDEGKEAGGICDELMPNSIVGAEYGLGYQAVAEATGGAVGSVCNTDLSVTIDTIITDTIGQVSNYQLTDLPIASSITVATADGGIIRRGDDGSGGGYWIYNPDSNSITFFGVSLEAGESVVIAYVKWGQQGS